MISFSIISEAEALKNTIRIYNHREIQGMQEWLSFQRPKKINDTASMHEISKAQG